MWVHLLSYHCIVALYQYLVLVSTAFQRLHLSEFEFLFQVCEYFHVARHLFKHWTKIVKSQNKKTTEDYVGLSLSPFTFSLATWLKHSFLQCSNQAPPCWANSSSSEVNSLKINPRVVAPPITLAVLFFFLGLMHSHVIVVVCVTNIDDMTHFAREGLFVMNSCLVDDKIDFLCKSLCTLIAKEVHLAQMFDDDWSVKSWCFAFHLLKKGFLL